MKEKNHEIEIIYQDDNVLVIDKPAGIVVYTEGEEENTLMEILTKDFPYLKKAGIAPRYGIVHRLDKDTSGIILIAKDKKTLDFLQKQFKERKVKKEYLALVDGNIKEDSLTIETLIGRHYKNRLKQRIYPHPALKKGQREAKTIIRVEKRYFDGKHYYCLLRVRIETGRKHQIRCHMAHIHHPIIGDKLYVFKNQPCPKCLSRHFLHARSLKIKLMNNKEKEFVSDLPEDLKDTLKNLKQNELH